MKFYVAVIVFLAVFFTLATPAFAVDLPGGIAAKMGSDVVYFDFRTKEKIVLAQGVNGPFAVAEDGTVICATSDSKIWRKKPGSDINYLQKEILPQKAIESTRRVVSVLAKDISYADYVFENHIGNLAVSKDGNKLSYEMNRAEDAWVLLPTKNRLPVYGTRPDVARVTKVVKVGERYIAEWWSHFGNSAIYPGHFPFMPTHQEQMIPMQSGPGWINSISLPKHGNDNSIGFNLPDTIARFSIKRNACFAAWSRYSQNDYPRTSVSAPNQSGYRNEARRTKSENLVAVIYQTQAGFGPIEIRDETKPCIIKMADFKKAVKEGRKPGFYEIPIPQGVTDCQGLAWKPDGSLTLLVKGSLYSFDGNEIRHGIDGSSIGHAKSAPPAYYGNFIPLNNIFLIQPLLVAQGINGDNVQWIDDNRFVYRGRDGKLCLWESGDQKNLLASVPERFFWTNPYPGGLPGHQVVALRN